MFDLRYHVASLAAVFVALVLGIFVGVGLSGKGFVSDAERENLQAQIDALRAERDSAVARAAGADSRGLELDEFAETTYPQLVAGMLEGRTVGIVFVGSVDQGLANSVRRSVDDAGGRVVLVRALRVPVDAEATDAALRAEPDTRELVGLDNRERLGRELARELVTAGPNPVFDRLARVIVEEQSGAAARALDAVVVARSAVPQRGETARLLAGLYSGLAAAPVPAVGVETNDARQSTVGVFHRRGLGTVDGADTPAGRVALVFLLAGARPGSYGTGEDALDGILPDPPPLPVASKG
ncbi:MAG: copper transporter [Gaiella sp.]|nr:copper transporter [Gaiella sp.]